MLNIAFTLPTLSQSLAGYRALIVPGLNNSDQHHWQSHWETLLPDSRRIKLANWATPNLAKWCHAIEDELSARKGPFIVIAHSFGALASARMAYLRPQKFRALFLVAPADPDKFSIADQLPQEPLMVKSALVASSNDPWMQADKAAQWAQRWGAEYRLIKNLGHINSASNIGLWPEGITQLQRLVG